MKRKARVVDPPPAPREQPRGVAARRWLRLAPLLSALSVSLLSGCDLPGKPNSADRPVPPEQVLDFSKLFGTNCAGCHGADGKFGPAPPLNDSLFRALIPEGELERVITDGRDGTSMPGFAVARDGALTPMQIKLLVYEIKGIRYKLVNVGEGKERHREPVRDAEGTTPIWGEPGAVAQNAPAYLQPATAPIRTSAELEQIRQTVFARACANCHGESGEGGSSGAIHDPAFLALISDQALRRLIVTGRPDLQMPSYAGTDGRSDDFKPLTSEEVSDLVGLLASWRTAHAAEGELEAQTGK